jgi:hypothetical protein
MPGLRFGVLLNSNDGSRIAASQASRFNGYRLLVNETVKCHLTASATPQDRQEMATVSGQHFPASLPSHTRVGWCGPGVSTPSRPSGPSFCSSGTLLARRVISRINTSSADVETTIVLTPSCGGHAPTAERTLDPARMIEESLTSDPGIREQYLPE